LGLFYLHHNLQKHNIFLVCYNTPLPKKKERAEECHVSRFFLLVSQRVGAKSMQCTPWISFEPKNHLFEKENHLNHPPSRLWIQNVNLVKGVTTFNGKSL